jgi:hypothetical protein
MWERLKRLKRKMLRRMASAQDAFVDAVLADVAAEPMVAAFGQRVDAILKANDLQADRDSYLWLLSHCPALVEEAAEITERMAGIVPTPVMVNGLKELGHE